VAGGANNRIEHRAIDLQLAVVVHRGYHFAFCSSIFDGAI
jgi:hypothetical protein